MIATKANKKDLLLILVRLFLFFSVIILLGQIIGLTSESQNISAFNLETTDRHRLTVEEIIKGIKALQDPYTRLVPSHFGHPGYERLAFTYDLMVQALVFKSAGYQKEAEEILDYFACRLNIPTSEVLKKMDSNNVYGIIKIFQSRQDPKKLYKGLVNAVNITSQREAGRGILEFATTPGPLSFVAIAMLHVNQQKYLNTAIEIGHILLNMQDEEGGIHDGDREPTNIHTEPHMDVLAVFNMLYELTGDTQWKEAADKCYDWFTRYVFVPEKGIIWQGMWAVKPHQVFAEDSYAWTMAGPAGDRISLADLKRTTEYWLSHCLSRVTVPFPDGNIKTLTLVDFTDSTNERCIAVRGGKHAMGSIEWTGGAILALQKNAVRFWKAGDTTTAAFYKAIAKILTDNAFNAFYYVPAMDKKTYLSFYASGQGISVGNFGSTEIGCEAGWNTPYWYSRPAHGIAANGGSPVGNFVVLPFMGLNPFKLEDTYIEDYKHIPYLVKEQEKAIAFINNIVATRSYTETIPTFSPDPDMAIVEPANFNRKMWESINNAKKALSKNNRAAMRKHFKKVIHWATINVTNNDWIRLARRDNQLKQKHLGGLVRYPWGLKCKRNEDYTHTVIMKYPLLNEIGASMWALAVANMHLGNKKMSKYWIGRIIDEVPLHQIPIAVKDTKYGDDGYIITGYWNALVGWEENPGVNRLDEKMEAPYQEVLKKRGLIGAAPEEVIVKPGAKIVKYIR